MRKYPYIANLDLDNIFTPVVFEGVDITKNGVLIDRFIWCLNWLYDYKRSKVLTRKGKDTFS